MTSSDGTHAGVPSDNTTMTRVIEHYERQGYGGQFVVVAGGSVVCSSCGAESVVADLEVDGRRRLEGASDPADMAMIVALRCPVCATGGTAIVRYGPEAEPEHSEFLLALPPMDFGSMDSPAMDSRSERPLGA
jgi:hypothetical protein